jgi:DNA-binding FadR family transcriptional regulator
MAKRPARTASETIAEQIRSEIATGRLKPGDMLPPERVLLEQYDVAQPTMRGALRILESDGLVNIERGMRGGARIVVPDVAVLARRVGLHLQLRGTNLPALIEAQMIIQPGVVALAARFRDEGDLARLRAEIDRVATPETISEFLDAVSAFTEVLFEAGHNTVLTLYSQLTMALVREGLDAYVARHEISIDVADHRIAWTAVQFAALVDLIEARDANGAEQFWRECLRDQDIVPPPDPSPLELYASRPKRRVRRTTAGGN